MTELGLELGSAARGGPRLAHLAAAHVAAAFLLVLFAPLEVLLVLPLVLGVPHVVNDVRYLLLRPPRPVAARARTFLLLPLGALFLLRAAALAGEGGSTRLEVLAGLAAVGGAVWLGAGPSRRRGAALLLVVALSLPCLVLPRATALFLAHGHNLVALGLWLGFFAGERTTARERAGLLLLYGAAMAFLLVVPLPTTASSLAGLELADLREQLAPGLGPDLGHRVLLGFALAQALHYSIWVHLLPASAPRSPRGALARWREELGGAGLALAGLLVLAVPLAGLVEPATTRSGYLSLVLFHGWLELAVAAHWLAAGRR